MTRAPHLPQACPTVPPPCPWGTRAPVPPCLPIGHGHGARIQPTPHRTPVPHPQETPR